MKTEKKKGRPAAKLIAIILVAAMVLSIIVPLAGSVAFGAAYMTTSAEVAVDGTAEAGQGVETTPVEDEDKALSSEMLEADIKIGYDNVYMINRQTPVKVMIYNKSQNEFKGKAVVKAYSMLSGQYNSARYVEYEQEIDINAGGAGEYKFTVFPAAQATYMNVKIFDENGTEVLSENPTVIPILPEQVMTGVLTDTKSKNLDYLSNLKVGEDIYTNSGRGYSTNYVSFLNADNMPESSELLKNFSAIIVDDFHMESLNEKQLEALLGWVENGGMLAIGTGLNADKTLKNIGDKLGITLNGYSTANIFGGTADVADITVADGEESGIENGTVTAYIKNEGAGLVVVHTFDLGSAPFANSGANSYLTSYYRDIYPQKFRADRNYIYSPNNVNSINRLPSIEKSSFTVLIVILLVYAAVIGPVCYLVLKKADKREKGWIVIPAASVAFAVIIFVMSSVSYQKDALISIMSYTNLDALNHETNISVGIRTPDKGDVKIGVGSNVNITSDDNYYYYNYNSSSNNSDYCEYTVSTNDTETAVTYYDCSSWQSNIFYSTVKNTMSADDIKGDFTIEGTNIVGTVTNNSANDIVDLVVSFGGQYARAGFVAAGDSVDVSIPLSTEEIQKWTDNRYQMISQIFYGLNENQQQASMVFRNGVSADEAYKLEQRFELLNYTGDIWNDNNLEFEVNLYAYTENSLLDGARTINGKEVNENWENLYKKSVPVDISKSTNYDIPEGYLVPTEIYLGNINDTASMDIYNFEIYTMTSDTIECIYDLGQCNSIREIGITWDNYDGFRNEPLIYNNVTGRYESLKTADIKNNVGAYVSEDGKLRLYSDVYSDTYITFPKLSLKGGNK